MLSVISAPRYLDLERHLLAGLMSTAGDPLRLDTVIVPSAALRRRLTLAIAERHGICARIEFAFLAQWLWRQIALLVPDVPPESPFDPGRLRWRIDRLLDDPAFVAAHDPLAAYLAAADPIARFALASRLAHLFDQYLTYRPEWLAAWADGVSRAGPAGAGAADADDPDARWRADELWQSALWRALLARMRTSGAGRAALREHPARGFLARIERLSVHELARLFPGGRVRVFGLPTMPPLYLDMLSGLARRIDVDLYVQNPCQHYWQDLVSEREHARRVVAGTADYHEVGHRLLSAWGRQTQAYLHLLAAVDTADERDAASASSPVPRAGLLARLQDGIRKLVDLSPGSFGDLNLPSDAAVCDPSLEIHACHSLTRELEVLQDVLLDRLSDPRAALHPAEILVVVPDLEAAAPLIDGVFGNPPRHCAIPYAITGLAALDAGSLAQSLLMVLRFSQGRMPLSELVDLLHRPEVAATFELDPAAIGTLSGLLQAADVHWGLDAGQRRELDLPDLARHGLVDGCERLLLGHALPDGHPAPWQGVLPAGSAEGADSLLLGTLDRLVARLRALRLRLRAPASAEEWQRLLHEVLQQFLAVDPPAPGAAGLRLQAQEQRQTLLEQIARHVQDVAAAAPGVRHPVEVLLQALGEVLEVPAQGGVPTGALTFAAMSSLRGLPFRMICVLGLDDGVFPAVPRPLEFDLLSRRPRPGDRQRGEDDRNLFLDLLLAAQETLYLSWCGRSARDNSLRPPSPVLAELIDSLAIACAPQGADAATLDAWRSRLVCRHPLQAFDERYFLAGNPGLFSFRGDFALALRERARALAASGAPANSGKDPGHRTGAPWPEGEDAAEGPDLEAPAEAGDEEAAALAEAAALRRSAPAFLPGPLPPPEVEWRQLDPERLIRFLQHPARALLTWRLGLQLPDTDPGWDDAEDLVPSVRGRQALAERILPALLAGTPLADCQSWVAAGLEFPPGALGDAARSREFAQLARFAADVRRHASAPLALPAAGLLQWNFEGQAWTLAGPLGPFHRDAEGAPLQLVHAYRGVGVREELRAWVTHLWALANLPDGIGIETLCLGRDRQWRLRTLPADVARGHLATLIGSYRTGLQRPLRFYPRTARALLEHGRMTEARAAWQVSRHHPHGESGDPAWQLVLRGVDEPLDAEFEQCARTILEPLLAAGVA